MENKNGTNVFKNKNFRLVFFGTLVSELGAVLYNFAVSFYILEITGNNAFLQGLYLALCGLTLLIFMPVGGVMGDRFNKARIMFICDYVKGGVIILATVLMVLFSSQAVHLIALFAAGILGNAIGGIFSPAAGSLFPHIVDEEMLQQANSYFSMKNSMLTIAGVVLAGIMYAALPVTALFFFVGICYVLSGVSEMFIRYRHVPAEGRLTVRTALLDMKDGLLYLRGQKGLLTLMAAILFINFFIVPISGNFLPYFIKTDVAGAPSYLFDSMLTPELWSSVFSILMGAASLAASVFMSTRPPKNRCGRRTAVKLCVMAAVMFLIAAGYHMLVGSGRSLNGFLILYSVTSLVFGLLLPVINIPISTTIMRIVDRDKLSKVTSIINMLSQGLIPLSSVLAGITLQGFGSTALLFICAAGFTVPALFLLASRAAGKV